MSYAPVNNILVIKGKVDTLNELMQDRSISDKFSEVTDDVFPCRNFDPSSESDEAELWWYYETNGEPHEEVPVLIKKTYPKLRVFFSSIDYDEWCFAYYKEFGMGGIDPEYNYGTRNEEKIDKIFENFVSN